MKLPYIAGLLVLAASQAFSQSIGWKPVTAGNPQWSNSPAPSVSFTPVGPMTYGSDGSSSYQTGNTSANSDGTTSYRSGNTTTRSDGTRMTHVGEFTYIQRPDGSQFVCSKQGDRAVCNPR